MPNQKTPATLTEQAAAASFSPARTVIVCGATSQIGRFLLPRLAQAGWQVIALSRQLPPAWSQSLTPTVRWLRADIQEGESLQSLPAATTLMHLGPLAILPANLACFADLGVKRLIAFSTSSKLSKAHSPIAAEQAFAARLQAAEDSLAEQCEKLNMHWTVFRPTLIYGCGMDRNVSLIARMIQHFGIFPLLGAARGLRQPVHADDLATACLAAAEAPASYNKSYELSGGETLTYRAMVERIFMSLGRPPRFITIPTTAFALILRLLAYLPRYRDFNVAMAQRMNQDLVYGHEQARQDFGYQPRDFQP